MIYLLSIIPIILYLCVLILLDSFSLVRKWRLALAICCGAAGCAASFFIFNSAVYSFEAIEYIVPVFEEFLKGLVILLFIRMKKVLFAIDATIYGAAVGGGFALMENVIYIIYNPELSVSSAIFRGLGTGIMHMCLTAMVGILLIMIARKWNNSIICYPLALVPSILFHLAFNQFFLNPLLLMAMNLLLFTAIFTLLFYQNHKSIYKWLDNTIESDAKLLSAMKQGKFSTTPAGQYLLSVKSQFRPDVFFDMYCYVQLYLELSLAAKRNLMLSEAGFLALIEPEANARIEEFYALKKRIGKIGEIALNPIVKVKNIDRSLISNLK